MKCKQITNHVNVFIVIVNIIILVLNCDMLFIGECPDKYILELVPYTGINLRTNGYYYYDKLSPRTDILFFYGNGKVYNLNNTDASDITELEEAIKKGLYYACYRFGRFNIVENALLYEFYQPTDDDHCLYQYNGIIDTDSTFVLKGSSRIDGKYHEVFTKKYYFKQLDSKPDSSCKVE